LYLDEDVRLLELAHSAQRISDSSCVYRELHPH
jgi:hypothetical protein